VEENISVTFFISKEGTKEVPNAVAVICFFSTSVASRVIDCAETACEKS
jgi:hypothetical protein